MTVIRLKQILFLLLLLLTIIATWGVIRGLAELMVSFQRGADPASALNIVPNKPPDLYVGVEWLPDASNSGRVIEPAVREEIQAAYVRAWLQWNLSYVRGEPYGLETYFTGPALQAASTSVHAATTQGWQVTQVDTEHTLKLRFYSADGNVAALSDEQAWVVQIIRDRNGHVVFAGETRAQYDVLMLLKEGRWRVRAWRRGPELTRQEDTIASREAAPQPNQHLLNIAGINYYPQATPWDRFWDEYNQSIIDQDFARIRSLGLNTIRIFVPYEQFGGPHVSSTMADRLDDLLRRADSYGLKVIVTLFDFRSDYTPLHWPDADRHLEALLKRFANNDTILAWDLKNEPDRDYAAAGHEIVDAWLAHIVDVARSQSPSQLLTIGWSTPEAAATLADRLDLVSFHFYAPAAQLPDAVRTLRSAAPSRPLLLSEFGLPTWNSAFFPHGHNEHEQAAYYADLLETLRSEHIGYLAWTLHDFDYVPINVAGLWPWQTGPQRQLGVLRNDGSPKPAATLLAPDASLSVDHPKAWERLLKPFWLTLTGLLALLISVATARIVVYRTRLIGRQFCLLMLLLAGTAKAAVRGAWRRRRRKRRKRISSNP